MIRLSFALYRLFAARWPYKSAQCRVIVSSEPEAQDRLDVSAVRDLSGVGGKLSVRNVQSGAGVSQLSS